jgi:uncharacterized protein
MPSLDPLKILSKYFDPSSKTYELLLDHGQKVAAKARQIADLNPDQPVDKEFLSEAAILHDIGICKVNAPKIGCFGELPYVCHGVEGRKILEIENLPRHALVCERHVGLGLGREYIANQSLPLPIRDMTPQTIEEKIICLADKFYSKGQPDEKTFRQVVFSQIKHNIYSVNKLVDLCFALNYPVLFKRLNFAYQLPDMILSGEKTTTWRIDDEKDLQVGDLVTFTKNGKDVFASAVIHQTKETTFGQIDTDDLLGHEKFNSIPEMYQTYSRYYQQEVGENTKVKVIKFKLLSVAYLSSKKFDNI